MTKILPPNDFPWPNGSVVWGDVYSKTPSVLHLNGPVIPEKAIEAFFMGLCRRADAAHAARERALHGPEFWIQRDVGL